MLFYKNQFKITLFIIGLIVSVLLIRETALFSQISGYAYDLLVRLAPQAEPEKASVAAISISDKKSFPDSQWPSLIANIMQLQPAALVIHYNPEKVKASFYQEVEKYPNIYLLRYIQVNSKNQANTIQALPKPISDYNLNIALTAYPVSENGIFRRLKSYIAIGDIQELAYEFKIAQSINQAMELPENKDYLINFLSGNNRIPIIKSARVLNGQLISELIEDKVVLVGEHLDFEIYGLITPVSPSSDKMSLLEFEAYALDSVIKQKLIGEFSIISLIIILLAQIIVSLLVYQWNRRYISLVITNSLIVIYIVLAWLLLQFFLIRLSLIELILVQFFLHLVVQRYKAVEQENELQQTLLGISAKTQERVIPVSFYQTKDPWNQITVLVNQTLSLNRLIFLERIPNDHRVREIKALNCDIDDIHEMRRDYERTPYSTAIEAKAPIKIDTEKRQYLKNPAIDEQQFLVPLLFGGDILGFWAFGISETQLRDSTYFLQHVSDYARQISELLYYRKRFQDEQKNTNLLQRYLRLSSKYSTQQLLNQTVEIMNHRLDSLESVFQGISSATILYDLFGRVVQMNAQMEKFIYERQIPAYDMTALDFIHMTIGLEINKIRQIIEQIIIEQRQFSMPLSISQDEHHHLLTLKPLNASSEDVNEFLDVNPFQVLGILIELNDLSELQQDIDSNKNVDKYLLDTLKKELESFVAVSKNLLAEGLQTDKKKKTAELLTEKIKTTSTIIDKIEHFTDKDKNLLSFDMYPIDAAVVLKQTITVLTRQSLRNNITIKSKTLKDIFLIVAEANDLKNLFRQVFEILIDDAMEDSNISVEVRSIEKFIYINLVNVGFGLPDSEFQNYLFSEQPNLSREFVKLRSFFPILKKWGGNLSAHSNIGEGMKFTIKLKKAF